MASKLFIIFFFVSLSFGIGKVESNNSNCQPKFRKWEVICTPDRKHCYDANVQPKVETASKPTKRFWAKEVDDQCELKMSNGVDEVFSGQFGDGPFLEDISFENWIIKNECCKKIVHNNEPNPKEEPPTYEEFEKLERLNMPAEKDLDMENGWKMKLQLNPSLIACDPNEHPNRTQLKPKKVKTWGCNEDGTDCQYYWIEVFDGEYEGIDKNNPLSLDCQLIPEWDRKIKSGLYLICYESKLEPELQNIDGNVLASFCQKNAATSGKNWHGIAIKFWVTLTDTALLVDSQIYFSYTNKIFVLPQIKEKQSVPMTYELMFIDRISKILDPDGIIHDDYPTCPNPHENNAFQETSGLWLAFLDMQSNIGSIMIFSEGKDCHKWNAFLNDNLPLKTTDCISLQEKMDQIIKRAEEERKKVDEIMIQVMELRKKCNLTVDPEFPTPPPELVNRTRPYNGEEQGYGGYGDLIPSLKEANELLNQTIEECDGQRQIRKRQIGGSMFVDFKNNSNFKWSNKRWDITNPIKYTYDTTNKAV